LRQIEPDVKHAPPLDAISASGASTDGRIDEKRQSRYHERPSWRGHLDRQNGKIAELDRQPELTEW
jgi:hypothetical protein